MKTRFVLGIDPGLHGAFALYDSEKEVFWIWDMPITKAGKLDVKGVGKILSQAMDKAGVNIGLIAAIELVNGMPAQAGQFSFGFNTGVLHGVSVAYDIDVMQVPPAVWKNKFKLFRQPGESSASFKSRSRSTAQLLFPNAKDFDRKKDDGRAEALLIAIYAATKE